MGESSILGYDLATAVSPIPGSPTPSPFPHPRLSPNPLSPRTVVKAGFEYARAGGVLRLLISVPFGRDQRQLGGGAPVAKCEFGGSTLPDPSLPEVDSGPRLHAGEPRLSAERGLVERCVVRERGDELVDAERRVAGKRGPVERRLAGERGAVECRPAGERGPAEVCLAREARPREVRVN